MQTMRSMLAAVLMDHAARHGCSRTGLAERFGVPESHWSVAAWSLGAPSLQVERVIELAAAVASELGAPDLGVRMAQELPRGAYGVQEYGIRNAPTLGEAARRLVRYQHLTNDAIQYEAGRDDERCWLSYQVVGRPEGLGPQLDPFLLVSALSFIRELGGADVGPLAAELACARPSTGGSEMASALSCTHLSYGAARSGLTFPAAVWDRSVVDADPALLPVLDAYAQQLMPREAAVASWRARVRDYLRRQLSGGAPSLEECAGALGLVPRTLQRRLRDETDVTFRQVVDEIREEEARRLMATTALPVAEVSYLLGFSERRAFNRAFVRWTSSTPMRYREAHAPDDSSSLENPPHRDPLDLDEAGRHRP